MSVAAKTRTGSAIVLEHYDGKQFELRSEKAYAPGQPIALELALGETGVTLELKSIGSIKREDGAYTVRARATTLSTHARETLTRHFGL